MNLVRALPHLLVVGALAGCSEQTQYRFVGQMDDEYGDCTLWTIESDWYDRDQELLDSYQPMLEDSSLRLKYQTQIWFDAAAWDDVEYEYIDPFYIGGSSTAFPGGSGNRITTAITDYPCETETSDVPRVYWLVTERQDVLAALSLHTWQSDDAVGKEHKGRIIAFYELEDPYPDLNNLDFYYRDHIVLFDDDLGAEIGRDDPKWQAAEERAIRAWLVSQ